MTYYHITTRIRNQNIPVSCKLKNNNINKLTRWNVCSNESLPLIKIIFFINFVTLFKTKKCYHNAIVKHFHKPKQNKN